MFKERKTKFALLSLLSALVVASTAFAGISIYAQTDDSELTTFEEEAIASGEQFEDNTSVADVSALLDGLAVCNVANVEISDETKTTSFYDLSGSTPTVSVTAMSETEVAALTDSETSTAADEETSTKSADCVQVDGEEVSVDDATPNARNNGASIASTLGSDDQILVIEGQNFAPEQVVLMFTENALIGIDDVDSDGNIDAKIPMPDSGQTAIAGNDIGGIELRFLESGTQRTATFEYDGETLTAAVGGDIEAEDDNDDEDSN